MLVTVPYTDADLRRMNPQQLMVAIAGMSPQELRQALTADINSEQQAVILDLLARQEAREDAKSTRFQARLAIAVALLALAVAVAGWLGWRPL
jgi:type VI protein secretion system component VasF